MGHARPRRAAHRAADPIVPVGYRAPGSHALDVEIFPIAEFRRRVDAEHLRTPQRVQFHVLLYVTSGTFTHTVDFESVACDSGSLLVLGPGQVQQFDPGARSWQGWMALWRPEFLQGRATTSLRDELEVVQWLADLAVHRRLGGADRAAVAAGLARMAADCRSRADRAALHALLRHELLALLLRVHLAEAGRDASTALTPTLVRRFRRFRLALERDLHRLHRVADYARLLGCTPKSLQRATREVAGISAKSFVSQRLVLEARRLLVHTVDPVAEIAARLGFDEATNFVKFFRRETGESPGAFRRQQSSPGTRAA